MSQVGISGMRESGQDVRTHNSNLPPILLLFIPIAMAVQAIANIVKSSLGPQGLDKMLVDEIGEVTVTNDGATILKQLEVQHPAGKVIVELSQLQDKEVGDGTTSVVILASELLTRANELIKKRVHPTTIIQGFKMASREACKYIKNNLSLKVDQIKRDCLFNCAITSMSSKLIGSEGEFFAKMVVEAVESVKTTNWKGQPRYPIKSINIVKCHGLSCMESRIVKGYVLHLSRISQAMPTRVDNPRIACLDMNLNKFKCAMGV